MRELGQSDALFTMRELDSDGWSESSNGKGVTRSCKMSLIDCFFKNFLSASICKVVLSNYV
jgi:hypothetical protein